MEFFGQFFYRDRLTGDHKPNACLSDLFTDREADDENIPKERLNLKHLTFL